MRDFEEPTEPMSQVFLTPNSAPTFQTGISTDWHSLPAPQLDDIPFPKSGTHPVDVSGLSAIPPIYPNLPPAPSAGRKSRYPGVLPPHAYSGKPDTFEPRPARRSSFPALVSLFFVTVELLLLLRLLFSLFGAPISNLWVSLVYTVSTFFLLPFFLLLENVRIPLINGTEFYSGVLVVCAIFVYGFLSRILVRFLKALLNSH
jgi:hypothetical protein